MAQDYLLESHPDELLPYLSTLIEIQKSRMNPQLFKTLESEYCQWKYERVLEGVYISNSDKKIDATKSNNNNMLYEKSETNSKRTASMAGSEDSIKANNFSNNFLNLKNSRILLELKEGNDFRPWIYFKTVQEEGKERIGMFAGRHFPSDNGIGFYISYPWLTWAEPFTDPPPEEYDAYFQRENLLPKDEANDACMWFYDDEGFMTACNPVKQPSDLKAVAEVASCDRILGMGFHLVSTSKRPTILVDDDGCVKTKTNIEVDMELVM
jgi:hypothetical protein